MGLSVGIIAIIGILAGSCVVYGGFTAYKSGLLNRLFRRNHGVAPAPLVPAIYVTRTTTTTVEPREEGLEMGPMGTQGVCFSFVA
ncbi:MAG: hypothetical protein Q9228_008092, partial [Teloschistes exilis]